MSKNKLREINAIRIMIVVVLGVILLPTAGAGLPPVRTDGDHDGIDDSLEQFLAERYAPMIFMESGEENYPINVDWHLQHATLRYHEDCTDDVEETVPISPNPVGSQNNLIGLPWVHPDSWGSGHPQRHCDEDNHQHGPISTIVSDPDGEGRTGYSDQATFYINDLSDDLRVGALDPRQWVTYFHAYPTTDGGVMIQYWHTFAYNDFPSDDHGGDWDASIQVQLNGILELEGIWFSRHLDDHPGSFIPCPNMQCNSLSFYQDTHPYVTIDGSGHASFFSPLDWCIDPHTAAYVITGHLSDIAWTDNPDDPSSMRSIDCQIRPGPPASISWSYGSDHGGTIWKTWNGGDVRQGGTDVDYTISQNPSRHGGLINMGEYNPCTVDTCQGTRQASTLLAGQFLPLNGQNFIRYSGRWGSTSTLPKDGPRGPVFQGFSDGVYTSWYNQGNDIPADPTTSSWRELPSTSLQIGNPTYTGSNGAIYVTGATPLTLTATQSNIATQYGPISTFYRFFLVLGSAGPYAIYSMPFGLSGNDGTYAVNYYSLDALNNEEDTKANVLSLDNSPPIATINAPVVAQYTHNSKLILDYTISDAGSGVNQFIPKMDGLTSLVGHGLQNGQTINMLTELSIGNHTFTIESKDNVDNSGIKSVAFEIIVTPESIMDDVSQFLASGKIKNSGLANSLRAKLKAAASKKDCGTAINIYNAFINELQSQSGKGIGADAAKIMIEDAQYLIAHCS